MMSVNSYYTVPIQYKGVYLRGQQIGLWICRYYNGGIIDKEFYL